MIAASIDIGTNSTRLLIAEMDKQSRISTIEMREIITRLGTGRDASGFLNEKAMYRVIEALLNYRALIVYHGISDVRVFATSATREAANRQAFLELIRCETEFECLVLSGYQEAELSFLGATSDIKCVGSIAVCDIGGGSTEIIISRDGKISSIDSLDMGSSRFAQYLSHDPPLQSERQHIQGMCRTLLNQELGHIRPGKLICLGGTASTMAMIQHAIPLKQAQRAHHKQLSAKNLSEQTERLTALTSSQRCQIPGLHPKRTDIIIPGILITKSICEFFNMTVTVSLRDLLYGILIKSSQ